MNRLQFETSPYLLQHKENPVDWYPWNEEAFKKAKEEDKPVLLSIGYSACHWCHVMAHESFENEETARIMNENFINIKVDREERPDVDNIYMNFVQLTTGSGGWPLTVALTPGMVPFFGGTYFPPEDRYGRPGFPRLLRILSEAYKNKKEEIIKQKDDIIEALKSVSTLNQSENEYTDSDFDKAFFSISESYDEEWGGFGKAPKFPGAMTLMFLLRYYYQKQDTSALNIVETSLQKMASGGIYDQIGGGFHRYSTDVQWLVPHFEKMLYDNALLARVYIETYQVTKNDFYLSIAEDILGYVLREMKNPSGGFYSAQDADSEGEEGKFFVWDFDEIKKIIPSGDLELITGFYGISEAGNFEGKNIITTSESIKSISENSGLKEREVINKVSAARAKLFEQREKRIKPALDDKIIVSWNSLMLNALCKAYAVTGKDKYLNAAIGNADFLWSNCWLNNTLFHSYKDGVKNPGLLDDYSFTAEAFLSLYSITFDENWIIKANTLLDSIIEKFYDEKHKDFFFTPDTSDDLIIRAKDTYDNAVPSGNSSAIFSLLHSAILSDRSDYYDIATRDLLSYHDAVIKYPLNFSYLLSAAYYNYAKPKEIVLISRDEIAKKIFLKKYYNDFFPFTVIASIIQNSPTALTIFKDRKLLNESNTIYVCENYNCKTPVSSFEEMISEVVFK